MMGRSSWLVFVAACGFSAPDVPPATSIDSGVPTADAAAGDGAADAAGPACVDANSDGACDTTAWLCGSMPGSPGNDPFWGNVTTEAWWAHAVDLAGRGRFVAALPGGTVAMAFRYDWRVDCPGISPCTAQLEVGLVGPSTSGFITCAADKTMGDREIELGVNVSTMVTVPTTPGVYDVRLQIRKAAACSAALTGTPDPSQTIAKICVPP